jgi:hypothetical protein
LCQCVSNVRGPAGENGLFRAARDGLTRAMTLTVDKRWLLAVASLTVSCALNPHGDDPSEHPPNLIDMVPGVETPSMSMQIPGNTGAMATMTSAFAPSGAVDGSGAPPSGSGPPLVVTPGPSSTEKDSAAGSSASAPPPPAHASASAPAGTVAASAAPAGSIPAPAGSAASPSPDADAGVGVSFDAGQPNPTSDAGDAGVADAGDSAQDGGTH